MNFSHSVRNRFIKDYNLPIQIVQDPFFEYYINELDSYFNTKQKYQMLFDIFNVLGSEEAFFAESNRVKDTIIKSIESTAAYTELQNNTLDEFNINSKVKQQDIYTMSNAGKTFISIDLKQANFNAFKMFNPDLVLGFNDYESLIHSVTPFDYFKKSKYLRQVIFGNLLPKKQQKLQKWVISKIINVLNTGIGIQLEDFVTSSSDEVVIVVEPDMVNILVETIIKKLGDTPETNKFTNWSKIDAFTLKSIGGRKFFVKENLLDGTVDFKSIQSYFFIQVYKKYFNKPINEMDRKFYFDGNIATFDKGIFE